MGKILQLKKVRNITKEEAEEIMLYSIYMTQELFKDTKILKEIEEKNNSQDVETFKRALYAGGARLISRLIDEKDVKEDKFIIDFERFLRIVNLVKGQKEKDTEEALIFISMGELEMIEGIPKEARNYFALG